MVDSVTDADIPEGISPDAATSWPSRELIDKLDRYGFDVEAHALANGWWR